MISQVCKSTLKQLLLVVHEYEHILVKYEILYIQKYWQSLNLAIYLNSDRNALLAEFKFGGLLRYVIA